ncbi:MAG: bifunctional phosphopantothenoylcysteine decarboxylase/phosphopantothenate--cysteine ligase CoaBC [Methanomassiliicoccaceae archaeon]|jgi:phosphopantothenoylcysteine decarboxylase/phosphopantothenate--cysteine ligase|nr:bifunctional phosphopantothenoylcysteine decarboxylase/phosphopantothenate--cysteine ligase CoaBC [Euryarchaeota archaeon]HOB37664.1 bifunctional phosphopantothenoylcysteine decarboxylase/phosphopantothenate--cysteine ligase CoaBC [Methanomassiliicoccaceae archaeon]HOL07538.1 bifunctional phosphopantothenoylcysteine decarboxylase/phosphopantothenate--cysteine ligase CoaBC [Methanomassiliicoccaceae archaeon]HOQ25240.1 bifunctional phosphopantothenoylcysteine decarboxylase/phosphopantothenate--
MHPSEGIRSAKSRLLEGKRIVLGITGSIAAVECFNLARELIRHGADVQAVMSPEALKLVTPDAMRFATGNEVITELDGRTQHVDLLGSYDDHADLLLIFPCTANTLSKMALGIDDTAVTTMSTIAIGGGVPVIVAPAMHASMLEHPAVKKNMNTLREMGVEFVGPRMEEKKAKVATVEEIAAAVARRLGPMDLAGRKVFVIGGASEEPIDDVRVITNRSTGETAVQLAMAAWLRGADVELWAGRMSHPVPSYIERRDFQSVRDLLDMVNGEAKDIVIVPAALSDYAARPSRGKIPSNLDSLRIDLEPLPKVLPALRHSARVLVGFKAEVGPSDDELLRRARARMEEYGLDLIVANDLGKVSKGETSSFLLRSDGTVERYEGSKEGLAHRILDEVR